MKYVEWYGILFIILNLGFVGLGVWKFSELVDLGYVIACGAFWVILLAGVITNLYKRIKYLHDVILNMPASPDNEVKK